MKALWSDIRQHPHSAGLFVVGWLSLFAYTFASWGRGMSDLAYLMHWLSPIVAGALVGWLRFPTREGLLVDRRRFAGAPLAGILVAFCAVSVVFAREAAAALLSGEFDAAGAAGFVVAWLLASLIFGAPHCFSTGPVRRVALQARESVRRVDSTTGVKTRQSSAEIGSDR